ncbi:hypothetical protein CFP56_005115 [Quercus suber]|uniref:Glycosyltransferase n=1 Tax=Quercus suber TaxID=58331 RepID=A0AAW0LAW5_QUESU
MLEHTASSSIFLYTSRDENDFDNYGDEEGDEVIQHEKIRPYAQKWEKGTMDTIDELDLIANYRCDELELNLLQIIVNYRCDVRHDVPAVFFSTRGYTGNVYHEFNDGILPLFITSQHFNKKVVFVILEYHDWWILKYGDVLSQFSNYPAIDFSGDKRSEFAKIYRALNASDVMIGVHGVAMTHFLFMRPGSAFIH